MALTFPHLGHQAFPNGVYLGHSIVLPPGGNVHYVRSTGRQDGDPPDLGGRLHATVAAALGQTRHDLCDNVIVLSGHAETLSGIDAWSAMTRSTRVLCQGQGTIRPTFRFGSGATDQLKLNDANVVIANAIFGNSASAVNTTLGIDVSAAGNQFYGCKFVPSDFGAVAQKVTTLLRLSSGADGFRFIDNDVLGGATTASTDTFLINAAVDDVVVRYCYMAAKLGVAEGLITCATAAPTNLRILDSLFFNAVASSTVALKFFAAATGFVENVGLTVAAGTVTDMNGTTLPEPTMAAAINTPGAMAIGRNVWIARAGLFGVMPATVTVTV